MQQYYCGEAIPVDRKKKKREGNTTGTIEGRLKKRVRICKKTEGGSVLKKKKEN
jgi:hypothetical protein